MISPHFHLHLFTQVYVFSVNRIFDYIVFQVNIEKLKATIRNYMALIQKETLLSGVYPFEINYISVSLN